MVKVIDAAKQGYEINDTMQDAPQQFGTVFYVGMVLDTSKLGKAPPTTLNLGKDFDPEAPTKVPEEAKRGRKPKE